MARFAVVSGTDRHMKFELLNFYFFRICLVLQTLLVVAMIAACFAQESDDASQLEGRGYFGYHRRHHYGGYGGYGHGYGGYRRYYRPYGAYGYGYGLGYRSGEEPAEGAPAPVEPSALTPN